ncbi:hypothetical protein DV711_10995 [Motiliproteus coralliicola]|uniref:Uncharacterized protein n=1 Tax=Motiliproteus coralliicola TaxID=2283196 RepID=A0A369WJ16_9GAMM|nr:hypothetical protein [Motiliproteus coralliicola]RDE19415.1 hypothetical protein DV711_10995 [Motiliproteus coralliicola]
MKLTYKELDSRLLKEAVSRREDIVVEVTSRHASALDDLVDIVMDVKSWPKTKPSLFKKWITLQKTFLLAIRALLSHAQLVELLPVLVFSKVNVRRSHGPDGALVLLIEPK